METKTPADLGERRMLDAETTETSPPAMTWLASSWPAFVSPEITQRTDVGERHNRIADLVSQHIIPRRILDHSREPTDERASSCSEQDVRALVKLVLGADIDAAADHMIMLQERGVSADILFLDLLEPAACCLGEMWERDDCDFIDVTLGVGRLQGLLSMFGDVHHVAVLHEQRSAFLTVTPGDEHFFGVSMVERFLRGGGWNIHVEYDATIPNLEALVSERWFAVAGLSLGSEVHLDILTDAIKAIRTSSRNRAIAIMVGGPTFSQHPELAVRIGADATAVNGPAAVTAAQKLFNAGVRAGWV